MRRYVVGRLAQVVPVLLGVALIVFLLVRLIPGDPATSMLGSRATPELVARVRGQLGLDLPLWKQFVDYVSNALHGDFGVSFFYQTDVSSLVLQRLPITLELIAYSAFLSLFVTLPFAGWAAYRRGKMSDHVIRLGFATALGIPSFWLGIVLALYLSVQYHVFPI